MRIMCLLCWIMFANTSNKDNVAQFSVKWYKKTYEQPIHPQCLCEVNSVPG